MTIPLADKVAEQGVAAPLRDAFELLSKPTLQLSDADLLDIANDLRAKRVRFLKGIADRPGSTRPKKAEPITAEAKEMKTAHVAGLLDGLKF